MTVESSVLAAKCIQLLVQITAVARIISAHGLLVGMCLFFSSEVAHSQERASISVGDTNIFPAIRIDYIQNDNALLTNENPKKSSGVRVSPSVKWVATQRTAKLQAEYSGNYGLHSESVLDYVDHSLSFGASTEFTKRKAGDVTLSIHQGHEELGTNLTTGAGEAFAEQVTFYDFDLTGRFQYGARQAKGNVAAGLTIHHHQPSSLKRISSATEFTLIRPFSTFSLRISPDTRFVTEIRYGMYDYVARARNRTDLSLLTGLTFSPTGKIQGSFRIGLTRVSYDSGNRGDSSGLVAEANLGYHPISYSRINLKFYRKFNDTGRSSNNSNALEVFSDSVEVDWRHDWSSRVSHRAYFGQTSTSYECPEIGETTLFGGIEARLSLKRWLDIGAGISRDNRKGDQCDDESATEGLNYDRQIVGAFIRVIL